eukprot:m.47113 g.47113  ORF g.47113 m.47113 type:complete len:234 (+) comp20419_c0_seq1:130-831(+)
MSQVFSEQKVLPAFATESFKRGRDGCKALHHCVIQWPNRTERVKNVIAMSDMHTATATVIDMLIQKKKINKGTIVICTGDMAGIYQQKGSDEDPIAEYRKLQQAALALYFVQGNHDVQNAETREMYNDDGTPCHVAGLVVETAVGSIGGVDGIIDDVKPDPSLHKYTTTEYMSMFKKVTARNPQILLTHTPLASDVMHSSKIHLYGHAPVTPYAQITHDALSLNMDGRIFSSK